METLVTSLGLRLLLNTYILANYLCLVKRPPIPSSQHKSSIQGWQFDLPEFITYCWQVMFLQLRFSRVQIPPLVY